MALSSSPQIENSGLETTPKGLHQESHSVWISMVICSDNQTLGSRADEVQSVEETALWVEQ